MDNKEIILAKIAEVISRKGFFLKGNSEFKARLKCVGLGEYFDKYSDYLILIIIVMDMHANLRTIMKNMMCFLD